MNASEIVQDVKTVYVSAMGISWIGVITKYIPEILGIVATACGIFVTMSLWKMQRKKLRLEIEKLERAMKVYEILDIQSISKRDASNGEDINLEDV